MNLFRQSSRRVPALLGTFMSVVLALAGLVVGASPSAASPAGPSEAAKCTLVKHPKPGSEYRRCQLGKRELKRLFTRDLRNEVRDPAIPVIDNSNGDLIHDAQVAYARWDEAGRPEDRGREVLEIQKIPVVTNDGVGYLKQTYQWNVDGIYSNRRHKLPEGLTYIGWDMYPRSLLDPNRGDVRVVVGVDSFGTAASGYFTTDRYGSFRRFELP